jgi:TatD DNase family protein
MYFTDTHSHIYLPEFEADRVAVVRRALDANVNHIILPNIDLSTISQMKSLYKQYPNSMRMAMGLHPSEVNDNYSDTLETIINELDNNKSLYIAVGEIGIDLYWDKTFEQQQMIAFDSQLKIAERLKLPAIIHCRNGLDQTLEVLKGHPNASAVFHCFGGSENDISRIRSVGDFYFGIGGIVTFKNNKLRDILSVIGIERILLETDAPYLAPVPHRGSRNESSYIVNTAAHIAQHLNIPIETVANITSQNSVSLFGF